MTADLTPKLLDAAARQTLWSDGALHAAIDAIAGTVPSARVDWDPGAGEGWARVVTDREVVAIIRVDAPFAVIRPTVEESVTGRLEDGGLVVIREGNWEDALYKVDPGVGSSLLHGWQWRIAYHGAVDPGALSINDFWWATE